MSRLRGDAAASSMGAMDGRGTRRMTGPDRERLSPCVCNTLRMVSRAVTQLYDDILRPSGLRVTQFSILGAVARLGDANLRQLEYTLAIDQTTLTRSLNLLERDRVIERVPHPDGRIKAMRLTPKGRRALETAWPLWVDRRGGHVRDPPGRRGHSIRAWGADNPARARVRVDARDRVVRCLHQPVPLWSVRA